MRRLRGFYLVVPLLCLFFITSVRGDVGSSLKGGGSGTLVSPILSPNPLDFSGVTNFTSTVKIYQTSTHTGNNSVNISHNGTSGFVDVPAGTLFLGTSPATTVQLSSRYTFSPTGSIGFLLAAADIQLADGSNLNPVFLNREAAATLQMGQDVNGAAVAQTLKAHDGITGTDIAGASLTAAPGKGTGGAVSGSFIAMRNLVGATGTTPQTQAPAYIACPTKILSNSSATAQTMATITTTSTTGGSVKMFFTTVANNGTLQDTDAGEIVIGWNNNAGTVVAAASAVYGQMDSDASGTLATTPTVTFATNVVSIKFTPTWVTIVPTTVTGFATFEVNGVNSIACQ